jgi:hypothetical protein
MPILWPYQNNPEPPDEYQHYAECALHEDALTEDGTALCECSAIETSRQQDQADVDYQRIKDEGIEGAIKWSH